MAWRHRSRDEKILIRVIGFLGFALTCFIITVIVMDVCYKKKIRDLEDEIDDLKPTDFPPLTTPGNITNSGTDTSPTSISHITTAEGDPTTIDSLEQRTIPPSTTPSINPGITRGKRRGTTKPPPITTEPPPITTEPPPTTTEPPPTTTAPPTTTTTRPPPVTTQPPATRAPPPTTATKKYFPAIIG